MARKTVYRQEDIESVKEMLPDLIMSAGLFGPGEEKRFRRASGGVFRCPVCGKKVKLYRNKNGSWSINPFGHCPHLGYGGSCGSNVFGVYAALHGCTYREAFHVLLSGNANAVEIERAEVARIIDREKDEARKTFDEATERNLQTILKSTAFGMDMPDKAWKMMESRGFRKESIPGYAMDTIGYLPRTKLQGTRSGSLFSVEGIVFRLGTSGRSFQIRQTRRGGFIRKDTDIPRFITAGESRTYWLADPEAGHDEPLFITEGPFDALSLAVCGAKRVAASIGAGNSRYLSKALRNKKGLTAFIAFDPDDTGEKAGERLSDLLAEEGLRVIRFPLNADQHDVNDLLKSDPEELRRRVAIARNIAVDIREGSITLEGGAAIAEAMISADGNGNGREMSENIIGSFRRNG